MKSNCKGIKKSFLLCIFGMICMGANAYDFEVDGICYNITSTEDLTCAVNKNNRFDADIVIPETVISPNDEKTYTVTGIEYGAFNSSITSLSIPNSIVSASCGGWKTSIQEPVYNDNIFVFLPRDYSGSYTVPEGIKTIGDFAFEGCENITSIFLPSSLINIGADAFIGSGLSEIKIPEGVTEIKVWAFGQCEKLKKIVIPNSVTTLGQSVFRYSGIQSLTLGNSITSIGWECFNDMADLEELIYAEGTARIFPTGITSLTTVSIPNSASEIAAGAFKGCCKLESISIPNSIQSIGASAFEGCSSIQSVVVPNSVSEIGASAFKGCTKLQSATLSKNITTLSASLFSGCNKLSEVTIPLAATTIEENVFNGCAFETISIPAYCTSINGSAFTNCNNLKSFTVANSNTSFSTIDGVLTNYDKNEIIRFPGAKAESYTIPNSITWIGSFSFQGNGLLKSINIPSSVNGFGVYAFANCTNLQDVVIEDGEYGLRYEDFFFSSGGYNIAGFVFSQTPIKNLYIGRDIYWEQYYNVGNYEGFFINHSELENVVIGNSVSKLHWQMFKGCTNISSITIPASVTEINDEFLSGCSGLSEIHCKIVSPMMLSNTAFTGIDKSTCKLYVPLSAIETYETTPGWMAFDNILSEENSLATSISLNETEISIIKGNSTVLSATILPTYASNKNVIWSSSNPTIASVTQLGGIVKGLSEGSASITATTIDGSNLSASCIVTITPFNCHIVEGNGNDVKLLLSYNEENNNAIELQDDYNSLEIAEDILLKQISYVRNYGNTNWQSLYVPFEIPVTAELLEEFDLAYINAARQYDYDDDGTIDELTIEIFKVKSGTLRANHPYLIRAKETGMKTITVDEATLYATADNQVDCSTTSLSFTFKGAYETLTYNDIYDCRLLGSGKWNTPTSSTTMKPMRFYLRIASRVSEQVLPASSSATPIRMTVWGEDGETTEIDDLQIADSEPANQTIFDMQGRPVEQPESGMYIINGKKVIVK